MGKTTIASIVVFAVIFSVLSGCAATADQKSSGVITSREATDIWNSYEVLPNYNYYYSGPDSQPNYIIGIDDKYALTSQLWKSVDLTPQMLKNWLNYKHPRVGYSQSPFGAFITDPGGNRIGLWYSVQDWRLTGSATVYADNRVDVTLPTAPPERKKGSSSCKF